MAYPDHIQKIVKSIPKQHHKDIQVIIDFYFQQGVATVQNMLQDIVTIQPKEINNYGVWHDSNLDGG